MNTGFNKFLRNAISMIDSMYMIDCITIHGKIDNQSLDAKKMLREVSVEINNQAKNLELTSAQKRGVKKLSEIAKNVRVQKGYMLASAYIKISVVRDKITTKVVDGKEHDDFSTNPYDFNYGISPDSLQKTIEEALNLRLKREDAEQVVCFATTKNTDETAACPKCNGSGSLRCESCGGSGREQYVDGAFASGEERKKTGQCSNCYGSGQIQCDECQGSGKRHFFSNQYQIIKRFEDSKKMEGYCCLSRSWDMGHIDDFSFPKTESDDFPLFLSEYAETWSQFDNQELESGVEKLYKNQKDILIDKTAILPNVIRIEYKRLYEQNKKFALRYFKSSEISKQGKLGCFIEKHLEIPVVQIYFSTNYSDDEQIITLYEADGEIVCTFDISNLPELSFFKSLF